jgi:putative oxidoreductase
MAKSSRYYIPAFGTLYANTYDYASLILRVGLGAILIPHGMQKLFGMFAGPGMNNFIALLGKLGYPMPGFWGWAIALTEFVGGILLVLGLFTRPVALALLIFMLESTRFTSGMGGFFWTKGGAEYSILLALCAVYFLIRGGGPYSLDARMGKEF